MCPRALSYTCVSLIALAVSALAPRTVEAQEPLSAKPTIGFAEGALSAAGLTPGSEVLVFGAGRVPLRYATRVHHWNVVTVSDGLGEMMFEVPDGIPELSIWVVVDLATGEVGVAAPAGLPVDVERLPPGVLRSASEGLLDRLAPGLAEGRILLVRPGGGAWTGHLADGAEADRDGGFNGTFEAAVETLVPVGSTDPATTDAVKPGDVLIVLDPQALRLFTVALGPQA